MKKELHVWFGINMPRWSRLDGDVIESYYGLCRVLNNKGQYREGDVIIHTRNIIFANSRMIDKYGFRLFIHPSIGDMFEITFGKCANTSREIGPHHDILKLLLSGEFDTDECQVITEDF